MLPQFSVSPSKSQQSNTRDVPIAVSITAAQLSSGIGLPLAKDSDEASVTSTASGLVTTPKGSAHDIARTQPDNRVTPTIAQPPPAPPVVVLPPASSFPVAQPPKSATAPHSLPQPPGSQPPTPQPPSSLQRPLSVQPGTGSPGFTAPPVPRRSTLLSHSPSTPAPAPKPPPRRSTLVELNGDAIAAFSPAAAQPTIPYTQAPATISRVAAVSSTDSSLTCALST